MKKEIARQIQLKQDKTANGSQCSPKKRKRKVERVSKEKNKTMQQCKNGTKTEEECR